MPRTRARRPKAAEPTPRPSVFELIEEVEGGEAADGSSALRNNDLATSQDREVLDLSTLSDAELFGIAWRAGRLEFLLQRSQVGIYDRIKQALWPDGNWTSGVGEHTKFVVVAHRRLGKSFICGVIACELAIQQPGAKIYWAAITKLQVRDFVIPILNTILTHCPQDIRPVWRASIGTFVFPNGSEIKIAGCETEEDCNRLRGSGCDLFVVDEAGLISPLRFLWQSVVLWMTQRPHHGRALIVSTPATSPAHTFTEMAIEAERDGNFVRRDVYESGWTPAELTRLAKECGGEDTIAWQREALALHVVDQELAVVPEYSAPGAEDEITEPFCTSCGTHFDQHTSTAHEFAWSVVIPEHRDRYVGIDWGHVDQTAAVLGFYDFRAATVVIEDERILRKPTTVELASTLTKAEHELWGDAQPHKRVIDAEPSIPYQLGRVHGVEISLPYKADVEGSINDFRVKLKQRKIKIHPRCRNLRAQLKSAIWNKKRTSYERMDGHHADAFDASRYLIRAIDTTRNPYPPTTTPLDGWRVPGRPNTPPVPEHLQDLAQAWAGSRSGLFRSRGR